MAARPGLPQTENGFLALMKMVVGTLLVLSSITAVILLLIPGSFAQKSLLNSFHWVAHQDKLTGALFLSISYAISVVFMIPGTPFNLAAGYLFGPWWGAPVALVGASVGGIAAFLLARTLAREWAEKKARQHSKFYAVDLAIQRNGLNIVFLMRLSPLLPFPLVSYVFGISQVGFGNYILGSTAGLIPVAIMEAMIGSEMKGLAAAFGGSSHSQGSTFLWISFVIGSTAVILLFITYYTQEAIQSAMQEVDPHGRYWNGQPSPKKKSSVV